MFGSKFVALLSDQSLIWVTLVLTAVLLLGTLAIGRTFHPIGDERGELELLQNKGAMCASLKDAAGVKTLSAQQGTFLELSEVLDCSESKIKLVKDKNETCKALKGATEAKELTEKQDMFKELVKALDCPET